MSINITGVHFSVTDALRDNVEARIKRLSKRYHLINANVSFSQSHDDFTCKVEYKGDNQDAQAQATDKDLYKAISVVFDRIERQLNDQKELAKGKGRKSIRDIEDESSLDETDAIIGVES